MKIFNVEHCPNADHAGMEECALCDFKRVRKSYVDIVFQGEPGGEAPQFVEVEDSKGRGIKFGEWIEREDGYWVLRVPMPTLPTLSQVRKNPSTEV